MALVLSDDKKSLLIVEQGPPTQMSLLANPEFCSQAARIVAHITAIPLTREQWQMTRFFLTDFVKPQLNTAITAKLQEQDADAEPFDIDAWYAQVKKRAADVILEQAAAQQQQQKGDRPVDIARDDLKQLSSPEQTRINIARGDFSGVAEKVDWFTPLVDQELRCNGFVATLANCVEMETQFQQNLAARVNTETHFLTGARNNRARPSSSGTGRRTFFSNGGVLAPKRN